MLRCIQFDSSSLKSLVPHDETAQMLRRDVQSEDKGPRNDDSILRGSITAPCAKLAAVKLVRVMFPSLDCLLDCGVVHVH